MSAAEQPPDVDAYCTVYVLGPADRYELAGVVADIVGGAVDASRQTAVAGGLDVHAIDSDDYDEKKVSRFPGGFLYFPFYLEVVFDDGTPIMEAVQVVATLLRGLWAQNWVAVAACD